MASLTLRSIKGVPLTNAELDANFTALDTELGLKLVASSNLSDLANAATARSNLGLGNVENKSSATIRGELTSGNVTAALGFTPYDATNPSGYITSTALTPYLTSAAAASTYQPVLTSGTSIKTVNGQSVLGSGNIQIDGGVTSFNTRTGAVTLGSGDVTTALGYTPANKAGDTFTGNVLVNSGADSRFLVQSSGVTQGQLQATASLVRLSSNNALPLNLSTNGVDRLTFESNGQTSFNSNVYLGIGGAASTTARLRVLGTGLSSEVARFESGTTGSTLLINQTDDWSVNSNRAGISFRKNNVEGGAFSVEYNGTRGIVYYDAVGATGAHAFYINSVDRLRLNASGALSFSGAGYGTAGQFLKTGGTSAAPTWSSLASSDVTTALGYTPLSTAGGTTTGTTTLNSNFRFHLGGETGTSVVDFRLNTSSKNFVISAPDAGAVFLNWDHGTGGVNFGNGAQGTVGSVSATGAANFVGAITQNGSQVLHAGNVGTYALPLSGGSVTGALNVSRQRLSFSSSYNDANHSIYNNYTNIDGEGVFDGMKMNVYDGLRIRVGNASGVTPTTVLALSSSSVRINTQLQAGQNTNGTAIIDAYGGIARYSRDNPAYGLHLDGSNYASLVNANGYVTIGPLNTSHSHFQTDRPSFYFNKDVLVDGQLYRYSGNLPYLHSGNYSSYSSFSGAVTSGGNTGFRNDVYYGAVRNPIWSFGNAGAYGISYFQGSAGIGGADTIGIHPNGTPTSGGSAFSVTPSASYVNSNVVLHAGNYTSYTPSTTGSGATGTWGISVTGSSGSTSLVSSPDGDRIAGNKLPTSNARSVRFDFAAASSVTGATGNYAGVMTYAPWDGTSASTGDSSYQLAFANQSGVNASGPAQLLLRNGINSTWNSWQTILSSSNFSSYAVPQSDVSTSGGGSVILKTASNGYLYVNNWVNTGGGGLFSGVNSAHFYPNDNTYGAWKISGSRNGWQGLHFDSGSTLMMNSATVGFHREGYGWQMRWDSGTGYISKGNPGGGTDAVILDSSNYSSYALPLSGGTLSGGLTAPDFYASGWLRNNFTNTGLYNQATGSHWYSENGGSFTLGSPSTTYGELRLRQGHQGSYKGSFYWDGSGIGLLNDQGGWSVRCTQGSGYGGNLFGTWTIAGNVALHAGNYSSYGITRTSGSPPYYGARAWVNFNGTGTVAIRASSNVSSITDNGVGSYTVNFTTAMADANYATSIGYTPDALFSGNLGPRLTFVSTQATSSVQVLTGFQTPANGSGALDYPTVSVAIFR